MKIAVVGLGYMGLPMAAVLARAGHSVVGIDIRPAAVAAVNAGKADFSEPGLNELVAEAHAGGNLKAVLGGADLPKNLEPGWAEAFVLSLPTPVDHLTHQADMGAVRAGVQSLMPLLQGGELMVLESTSPLGATEADVQALVQAARPELTGKVDYVFCPERAIPGNTLHEMVHNDRLVGGLTAQATARGVTLYQTFCKGEVIGCTAGEAELVKLVENASRDVQIAFANELSLVCQKLGLNVRKIITLANRHPRVNILQPAAGVGGHCIAVDPWFIVQAAPELTPLLQTARAVNDGKPNWVAQQVQKACAATGKAKPVVACLGLAYKPDVDDLRESPSLAVVEALRAAGVELRVVEPHLHSWNLPLTPLEQAIAEADVVVTLTAHKAFQELPAGALAGKPVVDAVGIYAIRPDALRVVM
jgi:UDP-N-acetyl-D-mannosaminuronic acid dehydrogenase